MIRVSLNIGGCNEQMIFTDHLSVSALFSFSDSYFSCIQVRTYDAAVILDDTSGKYINFKLEFSKRKAGGNGR